MSPRSNRRNSVVPPDLADEMDRVYAGALTIIARHRSVETAPPVAGTAPPGAPRPAAQRVAPPTGRPSLKGCKITPETRFRKAPGRTHITPGSLRARVLGAMPCTMAELTALLGGESTARGVVGKLREAGWLEIVSQE